jgi:hypothetical protein
MNLLKSSWSSNHSVLSNNINDIIWSQSVDVCVALDEPFVMLSLWPDHLGVIIPNNLSSGTSIHIKNNVSIEVLEVASSALLHVDELLIALVV